jgi:23S rRNA (uracil1939-C5)-methyltransferase
MRRPRPAPPETLELDIEKLGTEGTGLARTAGRVVLVPDALPGERVRVRVEAGKARLLERLSDSPDRVAPPCRHFGVCGGCVLQHLAPAPYAAFKRGLVLDALSRQGLGQVPVAEALISPPGSRRRATLEARRVGTKIVLGFHGRASHQIIDLEQCPVLVPALAALLSPLRTLLMGLLEPGRSASIILANVETGIDLGLDLPAEPKLPALEALSDFARQHDLARLWWRAEGAAPTLIAQNRPIRTRFGVVEADLPPGVFRQATAEGEAALIACVGQAIGDMRRIADLFAGTGTFTLALAGRGSVHAVESDVEALGALAAASRRAQLVQVTAERRDLDARPLLPDELAAYDAVVFDPPRAGAKAQAEQLAHSAVPVIVGVSCNPASFARDAAILVAGGYVLELVQPIDQFLWSHHIELVGRFHRPRAS